MIIRHPNIDTYDNKTIILNFKWGKNILNDYQGNSRDLNQAQIAKFLARVGSKYKINGPRLAWLEKKLARLGPGQKKQALYTSNI